MDLRMNVYSIRMLYVFPPLSRSDASSIDTDAGNDKCCNTKTYDLDQLERSFQDLLREDYPFFLDGEMHVGPAAEAICIRARQSQQKQSSLSYAPAQLLHIAPTDSAKSTCQVLTTLEYSFVPHRDARALLAIKCTPLRDGGLVIGLNVNHCVFDAEASFAFVTQWGRHYRRVKRSQRPVIWHDRSLLCARGLPMHFDHPEYIVPKQASGEISTFATLAAFPQTTMRTFQMRTSDLQALKAFATSGLAHVRGEDASPGFISSIDALTALLALLITQAREHRNAVNVGTAVNGRRRLQPPLPQHYAGNAVFTAFSHFSAFELADKTAKMAEGSAAAQQQQQQQQLASIALRIRRSIERQDDAFMRDSLEFLDLHGPARVTAATKFFFGSDVLFSSWVGIGSLDADFGAQPLCVTNSQVPVLDGVVMFQESARALVDEDSSGVDAVVYLEVDAMARLEKLWASTRQQWASGP